MMVRVWDLPTRLFHWLLMAAVIGSFVSVKMGGNAMIWHGRFGYMVLTLLIFRLVWGFIGPVHARFLHFVKGPRTIIATLKGHAPPVAGHNPLGALSVVAMLALLLAQAVLGLFTSDEIFYDGPFVKQVSNATVEVMTRLHKQNEWLILGLVALHLAAILFYRFVKKENLVPAMITGNKTLQFNAVPADDSWAMRARALLVIALAALLVNYLSR
jgi:cytochrome b